MAKILIFRGNRISEGAAALKQALISAGFNVKFNSRGNIPNVSNHTKVINWGVSDSSWTREMLNPPDKVDVAIDKMATFQALSEASVRIPDYDDELGDRRQGKWLARTELRGSSGEGIVVIRTGDPVPDSELYVKYIPKRNEYRLHVFRDKIVGVQQKRKREGAEQTADEVLIRNAANGWVFCVDNVDDPGEEAKSEATRAVAALGLDFAAVDLIIGRDDNLPYVLELNTAPGLESPTIINGYVEAIGEWLNE